MSDNFLFSCRSLYLNGIEPFDFDQEQTPAYQQHITLGQQSLYLYGIQEFLGFLMEPQYCVAPWAAFIGLEFGRFSANKVLKISGRATIVGACLNTVKSYHSHTIADKRRVAAINWVMKMQERYRLTSPSNVITRDSSTSSE